MMAAMLLFSTSTRSLVLQTFLLLLQHGSPDSHEVVSLHLYQVPGLPDLILLQHGSPDGHEVVSIHLYRVPGPPDLLASSPAWLT